LSGRRSKSVNKRNTLFLLKIEPADEPRQGPGGRFEEGFGERLEGLEEGFRAVGGAVRIAFRCADSRYGAGRYQESR
jgi:hypothetical protein